MDPKQFVLGLLQPVSAIVAGLLGLLSGWCVARIQAQSKDRDREQQQMAWEAEEAKQGRSTLRKMGLSSVYEPLMTVLACLSNEYTQARTVGSDEYGEQVFRSAAVQEFLLRCEEFENRYAGWRKGKGAGVLWEDLFRECENLEGAVRECRHWLGPRRENCIQPLKRGRSARGASFLDAAANGPVGVRQRRWWGLRRPEKQAEDAPEFFGQGPEDWFTRQVSRTRRAAKKQFFG